MLFPYWFGFEMRFYFEFQKKVQEDGKLLPEFADVEERE